LAESVSPIVLVVLESLSGSGMLPADHTSATEEWFANCHGNRAAAT
jgi:hypothetical protein